MIIINQTDTSMKTNEKTFNYQMTIEKKKYNVKIIHTQQSINNILNFISNKGN